MEEMEVPLEMVKIGRVFVETEDHITIEVGKRGDTSFTIAENDEFFSVLFVRGTEAGLLEVWNPFTDR